MRAVGAVDEMDCDDQDDTMLKEYLSVLFTDEVAAPVSTVSSYMVQLDTPFLSQYFRNGRRNLQCFPACSSFGDFYKMKMNNLQHSTPGVCRSPVYCSITLLNISLQDHAMIILGRFERVPTSEVTGAPLNLSAPEDLTATAFDALCLESYEAIEIDDSRKNVSASPGRINSKFSVYFLPDVWKIDLPLRKKRKASRTAPAQTYPYCFRVSIYTQVLQNGQAHYKCTAHCASPPFELYSTRTIDRARRSSSTSSA